MNKDKTINQRLALGTLSRGRDETIFYGFILISLDREI